MSSRAGRVSVVIPLYNHGRFITRAVQSVLAQGAILRELIVIDDGSSDDSAWVMRELARRDPRICFVAQENEGAHAAINRGLSAATGEYVTILNSDDAYEPGRLAELARVLDLDEGSALACSSIAFMDDAGEATESLWFEGALGNYKAVRDLALALVEANFVMTTSNIFMRRELFAEIGDFAPLRYAHDLEFLLRCEALGHRLAFLDRRLLRYRIHASNTIGENPKAVRVERAICAGLFLHLGWRRGEPPTWERALALQQALGRDSLGPATTLCILRLGQTNASSIEESGILDDEPFRRLLTEAT